MLRRLLIVPAVLAVTLALAAAPSRAHLIGDRLTEAGIEPARLSRVGEGEVTAVGSAAKSRRVEIAKSRRVEIAESRRVEIIVRAR